ncbi:MAG: amidase family protein [Saprospiraceae bacterium]
MKPSTKKVLKWAGIILGSILLLAIALGIYVYTIIPKPIGSPVKLQEALFVKPAQAFPMDGKYIYKSATELAAMIRHREATSVEVVTEFLNNIRNNNYQYNALIWIRAEEALQDAQRADQMVAQGDTTNHLLLGVPVTIKEMYWVKGSPSTLNAKMYGFTAPDDATVVKQLKSAGAIILGTTNVPFMLMDYQTQGEVYPTASNPYDTSRTPGGSTGGGAAALAAGMTALELGSDMGGSIRIPSAFCGLYGLKTTLGAINMTEGTSPDTTFKYSRFACASAGPMARTAADLQLMWQVLKNTPLDKKFQQPIQWLPASQKNLGDYKIAWMDDWKHGAKTAEASADVKKALTQWTDSLRAHGVHVEKTAPDLYDEMEKCFFGSFASMMAENQPWLIRKFIAMDLSKWNADGKNENFQSAMDALNDATDAEWKKSVAQRNSLVAKWDAFFKQFDFFVCPVAYGEAIKKCPSFSTLQLPGGKSMSYASYFPFTTIFNATGHPCVTIPLGLNGEGLPIGVQIVGPYYSEDEMLHFAQLITPLIAGFVQPSK